ncbi:MAG: hypothetical protein AB1305_01285 [Candidatus Hadarchaeota archaeon]
MTLELIVYLLGAIFGAANIVFAAYAIRNTRKLKDPFGHRLRTFGAILFSSLLVVGAANDLLGFKLETAMIFLWMAGLMFLGVGAAARFFVLRGVHKASVSKVFSFRHAKLHSAGIIVLLLGTPFYLMDVNAAGYDSLTVAALASFVAAFTLMAAGERALYRGIWRLPTLEKKERRLLRKDIQLLAARLDLTNIYLSSLGVVSGVRPLDTILSRNAESEPALLDGYKLTFDGRLKFEPLMKNLDRIHPQEREQAIFRAFSKADSSILASYERVSSPQRATELVIDSMSEGVKKHGETLYDYALPAVLFKGVFQPLLMKCRSETVTWVKERVTTLVRVGPPAMYEGVLELLSAVVAEKKLKTYRQTEPLISALRVSPDGVVDISGLCLELSPLPPEERIKRVAAAFANVMKVAYPEIEKDLGPKQAKGIFEKASKSVLSRFPELHKLILEVPKEARPRLPRRKK